METATTTTAVDLHLLLLKRERETLLQGGGSTYYFLIHKSRLSLVVVVPLCYCFSFVSLFLASRTPRARSVHVAKRIVMTSSFREKKKKKKKYLFLSILKHSLKKIIT